MKDTVTKEEVVALLNDALKKDKDAVEALLNNRVACNEELAQHPTIQVASVGVLLDPPLGKQYRVGMLGIINGMFGTDEKGNGGIAVCMDDDSNEVKGFMVLEGLS